MKNRKRIVRVYKEKCEFPGMKNRELVQTTNRAEANKERAKTEKEKMFAEKERILFGK